MSLHIEACQDIAFSGNSESPGFYCTEEKHNLPTNFFNTRRKLYTDTLEKDQSQLLERHEFEKRVKSNQKTLRYFLTIKISV